MPWTLTDIPCLIWVEQKGNLDNVISMLSLKALIKIIFRREGRINVEALSREYAPGSNAWQGKLSYTLPQQVVGYQMPLTMHIEEVIRVNYSLRFCTPACGEVQHIYRMFILNSALECQ